MERLHKFFFFALCSLLSSSSFAQQIGVDEARTKAASFLSGPMRAKIRNANARTAETLSLAYTGEYENERHFYVFNAASADGGYVIVGADEAAQEILGYSTDGKFDYESLPPAYKWWLSQYSEQIHAAIAGVNSGNTGLRAPMRAASNEKADIEPLLKTTWDQVAPFNSQIPLYSQGFTGQYALATGCVATAGAQVMKYFNWPESGIGAKTLNRPINGVSFSADFANTTYDWANMQNSYDYDKYTGSAEDKAVGTLMYHVGVAVDMNYGQLYKGGSSASTHTLAARLADTFKYDKGIRFERRSMFTDHQWEEMVYAELEAGRPVIYSGQTIDDSGHAFVCDGYHDGRFHINWGWSGSYNNYFLLTATAEESALAPDGTGSGGSAAGSSYSYDQDIVIGIQPDRDGSSVAAKRIYMNEYTLPASSVSMGERTYINGLLCNGGLFDDTFEFAVKLVNVNNSTDAFIVPSPTTFEIAVNHGSGYAYYNVPASVTPDESYYVYPMFKDEMGEWQYAQLSPDFEVPSFTINRPDGLALTKNLTVSNEGIVSADNFKVSFGMRNWDSNPASADLTIVVFPLVSGNVSSVDFFNLGTVTFNPDEEKTFELFYKDLAYKDLEVGKDYFIQVYNTAVGYIGNQAYLYFRDHVDINLDINNDGQVSIADIVTFINLGEEAPDFDNNPETDDLLMLVNAVLEKQQQQ